MSLRIGQRLDCGFSEPLGLLSDCHRRIEYFLEVLEDRELLPTAVRVLSAGEIRQIGLEMAARRFPVVFD